MMIPYEVREELFLRRGDELTSAFVLCDTLLVVYPAHPSICAMFDPIRRSQTLDLWGSNHSS